jgi:hypothetical protein
MKRKILCIGGFVAIYALFTLWWYLRSSHKDQQPAVAVTRKARSPVPLSSSEHVVVNAPGDFTPYIYPPTAPLYRGERAAAYVRVPSSGRQQALAVDGNGEFPLIKTNPGETVQVRLAFAQSAPNTLIGITAHNGGTIHGIAPTPALRLDAARQLAFAYTLSNNPGGHRLTIGTPAGEVKTFLFWAGPNAPVTKPQ